jgi:hypothetical protein
MNDELTSSYRRWLEADDTGLDDEGDAALGSIFQEIVPSEPPSLEFTARTMEAIAAGARRDARQAKLMRRAAAVAGTAGLSAGVYLGAGLVLPAMASALLALFDFLVGAIVRTSAGVQAGSGLWGLLGSLGHAASAFVADPKVTFVLLVLQGFAIAALVALQRLLGSDGDPFQ